MHFGVQGVRRAVQGRGYPYAGRGPSLVRRQSGAGRKGGLGKRGGEGGAGGGGEGGAVLISIRFINATDHLPPTHLPSCENYFARGGAVHLVFMQTLACNIFFSFFLTSYFFLPALVRIPALWSTRFGARN